MKKLLIVSVIFVSLMSVLNAADNQKSRKTNIAVQDFDNKSGDGNNDKYRGYATETFLDLLVKTKRFNVIDRKILKRVLKEKQLDQTGVTDASEAHKLKQILHAEFFIYGSVLTVTAERGKVRHIAAKKGKRKVAERDPDTNKPTKWKEEKGTPARTEYPLSFSASISAKLIDMGTSEIISQEKSKSSRSITAKSEKEANFEFNQSNKYLQEVIRKACISVVRKFVSKIPIYGVITKVEEEKKRLLVDIGKNLGLFARSNLLVYNEEKVDTADYGGGKESVTLTKEIAVLRVTEINDSFSYAEIFSGEMTDIKKGMKVKIIPPRFKLSAMLPSILVPGLGQMLQGNMVSGFGFLLGTGGFTGVGVAMLTNGLFEPSTDGILDTVIRDGDVSRNPAGAEESGRIGDKLVSTHTLIAYSLIGVGGLLYIWNIFSAGYPASTNPAFSPDTKLAMKRGDLMPIFTIRQPGFPASALAYARNNPALTRPKEEDIGYYVGVRMVF